MQADIANVNIGKKGVTPEIIKEIKKYLKNKKDVRIRFLLSYIGGKDRKEEAKMLLNTLEAEGKLVGNVVYIKNGQR